ncbi:MAG TPA: efflux RND transporter periplasmic adaptor subunit [Gemmataceae bacterium]|nr:efflux RND transporter periplasmic adaptor subunit [Gemmataceae bacterium]
MSTNLLAAVRRLTRPPDTADADLLARFARSRDEGAFRELVDRHGPMVLAVCRRVLGCAHDADDAFQATVLVLARRAGSVRVRSVGDWLHGVARRSAAAVRRSAARRRVYEGQVVQEVEWESGENLDELRRVLDDELARLPAKYRDVLVLTDLQEKDRRQVAAELGVPEGTVASRHARARNILAGRLSRRGWGLPAVLAAAVPVAVPGALRAAATTAGITFATVVNTNPASAPEVLAREVLATMTRKKLTFTALAVLVVGGGLAGLSAAGPGDDGAPQSGAGRYSVSQVGGTPLLLNATTGETWVLSGGKDPTWVAVPRAGTPAVKSAAKDNAPAPAPARGPQPPQAKTVLELSGRVVPAMSAQLAAPAPGVVARVHVREGDAVKAGQVLLELNDIEARLGVELAKAELGRAKDSLGIVQAMVKTANASAAERGRAEGDVRVGEAKLAVAEARLQATRVTAPFEGVVVTLGVATGEAVVAGGAPVAVVSTTKDPYAAFDVPEADVRKVGVGQPCTVRLGADDTEYPAMVVAVAPVVNPATATVGVRARFKLPEGTVAPRPGSMATIRLGAPK